MKRLAILISGSGSNLQAIIDSVVHGQIKGEIAVVISNKADAYGIERAKQAGIQTEIIDHTPFTSREAFDAALMECLKFYQAELIILAGFMRVLTPEFVSHFPNRIFNIHPSLLPKYAGLHTHQRAIDAGDKEAGATVHIVTAELDAGPGLIQVRVPIQEDDNEDSLAQRILQFEHIIYPLAIEWFCDERLSIQSNQIKLDGNILPQYGHHYEH